MTTYRPRITDSELFDLRVAIGHAIEVTLEAIDSSISTTESDYELSRFAQFCSLYVKVRSLDGFRGAALQRVALWENRAEAAAGHAVSHMGA